jgi:Plant transposon protein
VYWKNCPTAWAGQYQGREGSPTIVLEAIVDDRRRFQHAYIAKPGSCNDINVLESSTLKTAIIAGRWPPKVEFNICGVKHNLAYVLPDGIYPNWRCFVQTVPRSSRPTPAQMAFSAAQESVRNDV